MDVDDVTVARFRAVAEQERRVLHHLIQIEARHRKRLGTRVGEERPDRVVEAVRFAKDDVHELRLFLAERQLLAQHLDGSRH